MSLADWSNFEQEGENYNYIKQLQAQAKSLGKGETIQGGLALASGLATIPKVFEHIKAGYKALTDLKTGLEGLPDKLDKAADEIGDIAEKATGKFKDLLSDTGEAVKSKISDSVESIKSLGGEASESLEKAARSAFGSFAEVGKTAGEKALADISEFKNVVPQTIARIKSITPAQAFEEDPENLTGIRAVTTSAFKAPPIESIETSAKNLLPRVNLNTEVEMSNLGKTATQTAETLEKSATEGIQDIKNIGSQAVNKLSNVAEEAAAEGEQLAKGAISAGKAIAGEAAEEAAGSVLGAVSEVAGPIGVLADVGFGLYSLISGKSKPTINLPIPSLQMH